MQSVSAMLVGFAPLLLVSGLACGCGADAATGSKDGGPGSGGQVVIASGGATGTGGAPAGASGITGSGAAGNGGASGGSGTGGAGNTGGSAASTSSGGSSASGGSGVSGGAAGSGGSLGMPDASTELPPLSPGDAACRTGGAISACVTCCSMNHGTAFMMQTEAARSCACTVPGSCATVCANSYCMSMPQTVMGCYDCVFPTLAVGGECFQSTADACQANADCLGYVVCRANCLR